VDGAVDLELQEEMVGADGRERRQSSTLPARAGRQPELREDLTESELRVLRFLPSNLSAPEIGREFYLSLSTVKTHMRHIYAKLGVHRRTQAVDRARELACSHLPPGVADLGRRGVCARGERPNGSCARE